MIETMKQHLSSLCRNDIVCEKMLIMMMIVIT